MSLKKMDRATGAHYEKTKQKIGSTLEPRIKETWEPTAEECNKDTIQPSGSLLEHERHTSGKATCGPTHLDPTLYM